MTILKRQRRSFNIGGFTLVELLVALVITSLILTAVATIAYALSAANDSTDDTAEKQAQVRYVTLRIGELIRHCKLICGVFEGNLALWRADDNGNSQINLNEVIYIEHGSDGLRLCEFSSLGNSAIKRAHIDSLVSEWWLAYSGSTSYTQLIPEASNVQFEFDEPAPASRFVSVSFDIVENGVSGHYQINAALRGWSGNLLDEAGEIVVGDDD